MTIVTDETGENVVESHVSARDINATIGCAIHSSRYLTALIFP